LETGKVEDEGLVIEALKAANDDLHVF
jgi:hypothetical protein